MYIVRLLIHNIFTHDILFVNRTYFKINIMLSWDIFIQKSYYNVHLFHLEVIFKRPLLMYKAQWNLKFSTTVWLGCCILSFKHKTTTIKLYPNVSYFLDTLACTVMLPLMEISEWRKDDGPISCDFISPSKYTNIVGRFLSG